MIRQILTLVLLALHPAPASQSQALGDTQKQRSDPVLRVDGEEISSEEYTRWLIDNFGARLATTFAGDHLIGKEAQRRGIELPAAEVEAELEKELSTRIDGAFLGSKDAWLAELARTQRSEVGIRAQRAQEIGVDLLTRKVVATDRVVPENKIVREWELSYGRGGRAYDLSMLLVRCEFLTPQGEAPQAVKDQLRQAEIDTKKKRALELRERIVKGGDFAKLAREASDDELSRANGGKPPQGFRHFGWPKNFLDALDLLAKDEISQPIYAKGGWWIVRVDGLRLTALDSVRGELVKRLVERGPEQDETGTFRNTLVEAARIEVLPTLFVDSSVDVERAALLPGLSIDGEPVSRATYGRWILRTRGEASWPNFVEHRVAINEARRRGVEVSAEEVRARTQDYLERLIKMGHEGTREAWAAHLKLSGRDEASFIHDLDIRMRIELLCEKLIMQDRKITPAAVRLRFEELYGKDGQSAKVRLILLHVPYAAGPADETREQLDERLAATKKSVLDRANALAQIARDGGDFASLARQYSQDPPSAANGGMLDSRFRPELWPEPIARRVSELGLNGVSEAMEFGTDFVVLQVVSRESIAFETVRQELEDQMRNEPPPRPELSVYRNVLMKRAKVEVLDGMSR